MARKKRECDKQFTMNILKEAYQNGTREVGFYMIGEPLMNADIDEFVSFAKETGYEYVYLTTNGALADIDRMKSLIRSRLSSVKFSVNAATPESYKKIHGADDYDKVKKNIRDLHEYVEKQNLDFPVFISFVKTKVTANEIDTLYGDFADIVDNIYIFGCGNQGGGRRLFACRAGLRGRKRTCSRRHAVRNGV